MKKLFLLCISGFMLVTLSADTQTFSVIHTFSGLRDGGFPQSGVTLRDGVLYGTTWVGDVNTAPLGTVYQMKNVGSNWNLDTVYIFHGEDGADPLARVMFGPDGHLYGTTPQGGAYNGGIGTVFSLIPRSQLCRTANCFWTENVLHSFSGVDGTFPGNGDLIWDQDGNIYGTTINAGYFEDQSNGNVFQLTPSGNGWTVTSLYSFPISGPDGRAPYGGVTFDKNGNLWGTTSAGGEADQGTVFELKYVVGVGWQETVVHSFQGDSDGSIPAATLTPDSSGNLFGVTAGGGSGGGGTIFELSPSGNSWTFQVLHNFPGIQNALCGPEQPLTMDGQGNLYGTTYCSGANQKGNVFKLTNTPNGWVYTSVYDFTGGSDGLKPLSQVTIDTDGTLYGTTSEGGGGVGSSCTPYGGCGTVWMIKP